MEELFMKLNAIHPLSPGLTAHILSVLKYRSVRKKELLLRPGKVCQYIYFISKGLFRCYQTIGGSDVVSWFMREGDMMISVRSFLLQIPSVESIQAIEDSQVYYITFNELNYLYENFIEFNINGRKLLETYYMLSEERNLTLRRHNGLKKYLLMLQTYPDIIQRVPAKELASYLGITEVTLSRAKSKFLIQASSGKSKLNRMH